MQTTSDFFAGVGDTLSFGLTEKARMVLGSNDFVNKCSDAFKWGGRTGEAMDFARSGGLSTAIRQGIRHRPQGLPRFGKPNSTGSIDRGNGTGQLREYGPDGRARYDLDFGHDHGFGDPHGHRWD